VGIVFGGLWVWGFGSLVAVLAGSFAWLEYRRAERRPTPAVVAVLIGLIGFGAAVAFFS
jgi:hypothetical protein